MPKLSAGLLPYRHGEGGIEVFLVHPGGPFWAHKDAGTWSIAKGEYDPGDDPLTTARREFEEEVGRPAPDGDPVPLGEIKQRSGKVITAFGLECDFDLDTVTSNTFTLEWPRGSGKVQEFPEVDDGRWMPLDEARRALISGQQGFLDALLSVAGLPHRSEKASMNTGTRILLIGLMGAGKSTVGKTLESLTGWPYLDNDALVHEATGLKTLDVLSSGDGVTLRLVERAALDTALAAEPPIIASVAAGVILDAEDRQRMKKRAFVVYLHASVAELSKRVGTGKGRPWIAGNANEVLDEMYREREHLFRDAAHLVLDVDGVAPEELADAILTAVQQRGDASADS